jgi:hypothetical protein
LDQTGLVNRIYRAAVAIDSGRKGFSIRGKEQEGRIFYEDGIAEALSTFQEAQNFADPETMLLAEYTFLSQKLQFCVKTDKDSLNSLTQAVQSFDDAFLALQAVEKSGYKTAEKTYPHSSKYRVSSFPKDAFHTACISHKTRLQNILRVPGIDPIEKALLKQRFANLLAAQGGYSEKQRKAMVNL